MRHSSTSIDSARPVVLTNRDAFSSVVRRNATRVMSVIAAMSVLIGCGDGPSAKTSNGSAPSRAAGAKPVYIATTPMVGDVVRAIAGDRAEVITLLGPGVDPHLWSPTRSDVLRILDADAVFLSGLMLEGRAGDAFARVEQSGRPVLRIAETLPKAELLTDPANPSHFDPHVWMDPVLWAKTAPAVRDALIKLDPDGAAQFTRNAQTFVDDAATLDRECALAISSIPFSMRTLITAHDAFGYYGKRYGLQVRGIQGISTESEASIADIERLVAEISENKIPAVFIETTVSDRTIRALVEGCAARGHDVIIGDSLYSDSLGRTGTPEAQWSGMIRANTKSITNALGGRY